MIAGAQENVFGDHDHEHDHGHDNIHDHDHHHDDRDSEECCEEGCGCHDHETNDHGHDHRHNHDHGHGHAHGHSDNESECCEEGCSCCEAPAGGNLDHNHGHVHDDDECCEAGCGCGASHTNNLDHDHAHDDFECCEEGCRGTNAGNVDHDHSHGHEHGHDHHHSISLQQKAPTHSFDATISPFHNTTVLTKDRQSFASVDFDMNHDPFFQQATKMVCSLCDPTSTISHTIQVTRFRVANLCCIKEELILRRTLENVTGIEHVSVNLVGKYAIIKHCNVDCCAPSNKILNLLNEKHLGVSVQDIHSHGEDDLSNDEHLGWIPITHSIVITLLFIIGMIFNFVPTTSRDPIPHPVIAKWIFLISVVIGGIPIFKEAFISLFIQREIDIHCLMILAIIGACIGKEFFDASLVIVLFVNAELIEAAMMVYVKNSINATSTKTLPKNAYLTSGKTIRVEDLQINDVVAIRAGEMIFCDGTIVKGEGVIDESALTGESVPVRKKTHDKVYGGTIIQNGYLEIKITTNPQDSLINRLNATIEEVQADRGNYATLVNQFSQYWTPFVIIATTALIVIGGSVTSDWWLYTNRGLVLLVLACPCAIVISAPIPSVCAISNAAKHGILIRGSTIVELLNKIDTVALDKTGTLTKGFFRVNERVCLKQNIPSYMSIETVIDQAMLFASALEQKSTHPLANAIIASYCGCLGEMDEMMSKFPETKKIKIVDGIGLEGYVKDPNDSSKWKFMQIGNERLLQGFGGTVSVNKQQLTKIKQYQKQSIGKVLLFIVIENELILLLTLSDELRTQSQEFIHLLQDFFHFQVMMLTGDHYNVAKSICDQLHIAPQHCFSGLLPEDKLDYIKKLRTVTEFYPPDQRMHSFLRYFSFRNSHSLMGQQHELLSTVSSHVPDVETGISQDSSHHNQPILKNKLQRKHVGGHPHAYHTPASLSTSFDDEEIDLSENILLNDSLNSSEEPSIYPQEVVKVEGNRNVLYVGDGINDSTALAASTVGVAMGVNGSAMAVTAAHVVLMTDNLLLIPYAISVSRYACEIIIENGVFAVIVKIMAVVFAIMGMLELWEAVLIDVGSLIIVVLNGMRVLRFKDKHILKT